MTENIILLFQDAYAMVVKSEIKISLNEKTITLPTVSLDGLHFLGSHWQFSGVDINMINCHAAFLVLELKHSNNVIIKNCTFGNWTFTQVQHVEIKTAVMPLLKVSLHH